MKIYIPHSEEWFKALAETNKQQHDQTKQIINLAGSLEVCSVCGDEDDIGDYLIENAMFADGSTATIRLCEDCAGIRKKCYNEKLKEME